MRGIRMVVTAAAVSVSTIAFSVRTMYVVGNETHRKQRDFEGYSTMP